MKEHGAGLDRRDFLKGGLTLGVLGTAGSLGLTGCAPQKAASDTSDAASPSPSGEATGSGVPGPTFEQTNVEPIVGEPSFVADPVDASDITSEEDFDVVVVGAGIAGAVAFASACETGAKTLLIEKANTFTAHGTAVAAIGSKVQNDAGITLDRDAIVGDAIKSSAYRCSPDMLNTWADNSAGALDWLIDTILTPAGVGTGIPWHADYQAGWQRWFGDHVDLGTGLVNGVAAGMAEAVPAVIAFGESHGGEVRYNTAAAQLTRENGDTGRIDGVVIIADDKYAKVNAAKGVILATGGYENNYERMRNYYRPRDLAAVSAWMNPYMNNMGDGHEMGLAVGAWEDEPPHCFLIAQSGIDNGTPCGALLAASWMRVNSLGKRFTSERLSYNYLAQSIAMQPGAHAWCIIPSDYAVAAQQFEAAGGPGADVPAAGAISILDGLDEMVADGLAFKGTTPEDLAEQIGVPADVFAETVKRYNGFAAQGHDDDYLTEGEWLYPVENGPFYALREGTAVMCTMNGLHTATDGAVIDIQGNPIEGLYAVGNVSGGMFDGVYTHHINGLSHGRCVVFGYLAGRAAAN